MVLDLIKTVFQYHADNCLYEIIVLLIFLAAGSGVAFLKRKLQNKSGYQKYFRLDIVLFCLGQVTGNIMLLCFRQEIKYLIISILLFLFTVVLLKNISSSILPLLVGVSCISIVVCCIRLVDIGIEPAYDLLRIFCFVTNILIGSDILLFLFSKKLKKNPVAVHLFRQSFVMIICFVLFVMPSNLNFVNSSGYAYSDVIHSGVQKKSENQDAEPVQNIRSEQENMLFLDKNKILEENALCCYDYSTENLSDYTEMHLNCHEFKTWYLNDKIYENGILNSVMELTKTYQINPSYLFTYILKYNSEKSREIPATASDRNDFHFVMDFNAWNQEELQADAYTSGIYNELMKNFSMLPEENKTFPLSHDANPFYTYFAYCDEASVYFVTLYLTLDETNQITEADYTMLQFIDFNQETEQLVMQDYATELESIYDTAFGNQFTKDSGRYDMILTQENDTVYFRRYYGNYTR